MSNGGASNVRLVVLAYILAISLPPVGLILGVALSFRSGRQYAKHGVAVIALSIIASVAWIVILTSGTLSTTTPGY